MANAQLSPILRLLRQIRSAGGAAEPSDGQLLERFAQQRDEAAFATLLRRHGPMVLSTCRRLLRNEHDAEDAFQATFLVLVRKAGSLGQPELLGNWLYGVAYRTAVRTRAGESRRRARERPLVEQDLPAAEQVADFVWRDLWPVLDEEVHRLPDKYRVPFVLCYLEGKTNEEAARQLGCPLGTVLSRLARARERLRTRLTGRGLTLSAGLLAALLSSNASATMPTALINTTLQAALLTAANQAAAAGMISAPVAALTKGVLQAMFVTKLKIAAAVLLAVSVVGSGVGVIVYQATAAEQTDAKKGEWPKPAPSKEVAALQAEVEKSPENDQPAAVELKWKFEKDKDLFQELTTETKQSMKVQGQDIVQNQKQTFVYRWTPKEKDKDGNWILLQTISVVKMEIEIGGNKISYDSTKNVGINNPLAEFFKTLIGSEFKLTLSPDMKVTKIEGREDFVKKLVAANAQLEPLIKQILGEEAFQQMADQAFAALPSKPVTKGDTWTKESKLNLGPIGSYNTKYTYTYEGKQGDLDRIRVDSTLIYQPPPPNAGGGLPFQIQGADLKSKSATGTILFDKVNGRLDSSEMHLELEGKLKINLGGMPMEVELSQTQQTTVKTTDREPAIPK
jgi:RNA polymerase sigma factor (sigma-70 family)